MTFDEIKALVTLGARVSLDAHALTAPQWVELAARAAQTGSGLTIRRADRLTQGLREQLAEVAGSSVKFEVGA
jgi:hypothetical protein